MAGTLSKDTKIYYSSGGWQQITNVESITGPPDTSSKIDVSDLDSDAMEYEEGLPDSGDLSLTLNLDWDNTSHLWLAAQRGTNTTHAFKIADSAGNETTFSAKVMGFNPTYATNAKKTAAVTLAVTGAITYPT